MHSSRWNLGLAIVLAAVSIATLGWWIPADIETGLIVEEHRTVVVGDALAPTIAAVAVLVFSLALAGASLYDGGASTEPRIGLTAANIANLAAMAAILFVSLALMIWAGPFTVAALQAAGMPIPEYRLLTDIIPYKYIGFTAGGLVLVAGLISWIEGRVSRHAVAIGLGAVAALIVVYDLPFDTLLLPPNGSQ